jgi:cobalt-zinc-cadmium efflux system protein
MKAIPRITNPEPVNGLGMLIFAILGVIVNGLAAWRLLKGSSLHEKTVSWHLLEDVFGWLAILAASIILLFVNIPVIDPILSVLITFYIVYHIIGNIRTILGIFLQAVPKELSIEAIEKEIIEKTGIRSIHHTHLWSLEGEKNLLSTHVVVDDDMTSSDIILLKYYIKELLRDKGISHITIEIEYASEDCDSMVCK